MTLGQKIAALRNQYKMSQGDLAEKMNVSRQSISKWETDTSIPELDKLILLSHIFNITMDELVKSENVKSAAATTEAPECAAQPTAPKTNGTRNIIGVILLCFGALVWLLLTVLGSFLGGLFFASPFIACGAICLIFKKNIGLWCAWALFFTVNVYLRYATGISWRLTLLTLNFEPNMNYMRLAFAWIELICFIVMIVITVLRFQNNKLILNKRGKCLYAVGWAVFALLLIPFKLEAASALARYIMLFLDWARVALFTSLAVTTMRLIRSKRAK